MPLSDIRHPDCRACDEHERVNVGLIAENRALRSKLADRVKSDLHSESDDDGCLAGPLGEAIAAASGSYNLEFTSPEQLAEGIAAWLVAE